MRNARRVTMVVLASSLFVASVAAVAATSNEETTASATTAAKWVPRKIHFMYTAVSPSSSTTYYSCDKLQSQMTTILRQLGPPRFSLDVLLPVKSPAKNS